MRPHISRSKLFLITTSLCALLLGCTRTIGQSWGGGSEGVSQNDDGRPADYNVEYLSHNGRNFVVLAVSGCSMGSLTSGPKSNGELVAANGRKVSWSCTTADGQTGKIVIDGREFDLEKGGFFIVSLASDKTTAEQVPVDMSKLQGGNVTQRLHALEASEPKIGEFWKKMGK